MRTIQSLWFIAACLALAGCGGGGNPPRCSLKGQTVLSTTSAWPKFRRDMANTGTASGIDASANPGTLRWVFPEEGSTGSISTTPVLGQVLGGDLIFFGSSDHKLYVLNSDGSENLSFVINATTAITSSPLFGEDQTLFVTSGDGAVRQFSNQCSRSRSECSADADCPQDEQCIPGVLERSGFIGGFIAASPNIGSDGTIYAGTLSGVFSGVCPNGVPRFSALMARSESSPAVASDRTIVVADDSGQVRAFDYLGRQLWSFFTGKLVRAALVIDESADLPETQVYVADTSGRVFAVTLADGELVWNTRLPGNAAISASPALSGTVLYVADESGRLYALDTQTGAAIEIFAAGAPVLSSPAVTTGGDATTIVFGAENGVVYAVVHAGASGTLAWSFAVSDGSAIGPSSPSVDADGTVYIGTTGGHLYAIGSPLPEQTATPIPTATATPTPTGTPVA